MDSSTASASTSSRPFKRKAPPADGPGPAQPAPAIDKAQRRADKKKRKIEAKAVIQPPTFQFNTTGFQGGKRVDVAKIRDFVLNIVADAPKPDWMVISNKQNVSSLTVLYCPGLSPDLFGLPTPPISQVLPFATTLPEGCESKVPVIQQLFSHACPVRAPGDKTKLHSTLGTFLTAPLPKAEKEKRERELKLKMKQISIPTSSPSLYLLTRQQMIDNDYPIPRHTIASQPSAEDEGQVVSRAVASLPEAAATTLSAVPGSPPRVAYKDAWGGEKKPEADEEEATLKPEEKGWVETPIREGDEHPDQGGLMSCLAMDCEMCMTVEGPFLARISVIDVQTGIKVYDEMVKPPGEVTDYLTRWSGVTPESLATATLTLAEVQSHLLSTLINSRTILIGHSLESDLKAIKLRHPWCIDTAILFSHPKGPPFKPGLKWLAKQLLDKEIQMGVGGHDPEEDARTCLELVEAKLKLGPDFGTSQENESIFRRVTRSGKTPADKKASAMFDKIFRTNAVEASTSHDCKTDEEVIEKLIENVEDHSLLFGQISELRAALGWNAKAGIEAAATLPPTAARTADPSASASDAAPPSSTPDAASVIAAVNSQIARLHEALPVRAGLVLFTGHSDPRPMLELQAKRAAFERVFKKKNGEALTKEERWMEEDERKLEAETARCREGLAFFCVKM